MTMNGLAIGLLCGFISAAVLLALIYYYVHRNKSKKEDHVDPEAPSIISGPTTSLEIIPRQGSNRNLSSDSTVPVQSQIRYVNEFEFDLQQPTDFIVPLHNISKRLSNKNDYGRNSTSSQRILLEDQPRNSSIPLRVPQFQSVPECVDSVYTISGNLAQDDDTVDEDLGVDNVVPKSQRRTFAAVAAAAVTAEEVRRRREINRQRRELNLNFVRQRELDCALVIAADATPSAVGGYCINLQENYCETYSLATTQIPWKLVNPRDTSEFEMKNLMFAIMLWRKEIQKYRKFRVYTDNSAITSTKNKFGRVANKLLDHCTNCSDRNVRRVNRDVYCNRGRELDEFIQFIQPADDLSRGDQDACETFIKSYYGIPHENFRRSFAPHNRNHINSEFLQRINSTVADWKIPCSNCGYSYRLGALNFIKASNWKNKTRQTNKNY